VSLSKEAESADDGFGNFGAASVPVAQNDEDEDFGNFGAPMVAETQAETNDDDGFGDFGDAGAEPQPPELSGFDPLDGEDNDFGDFGAAPSVEGDDVGLELGPAKILGHPLGQLEGPVARWLNRWT
jgi:hypothetical protein